ncbi:MAG TPA: anti-sigma factor [Candidatus Binataceae bacterium]|nr:anti-sigma factor [Candidatus Binataceae bacterium]
MGQIQSTSATAPTSPPFKSATRKRLTRRTAMWRAIAGMAATLVLASALIATDIFQNLVGRVTSYRYRIRSLSQKVDSLKRENTVDKQALEQARTEIASKDQMKTVLLAHDLKTFKLSAPNWPSLASGSVSFSEKVGGAVLTARGLPAPAEGQFYDAWWMLKNAPPMKAAEFVSALDGTASEFLDPPPRGTTPIALEITLEPTTGITTPTGAVKLRGHIVEERAGVFKKH